MIEFAPPIDLSNAEAQALAQGLYAIARIDGLHPSETAMIGDFYRDAVGDDAAESTLASLERESAIEPETLASILARREVGQVFIKTAWLMAHADGAVSDGERAAIGRYAAALGLSDAANADLEEQVKDFLLRQLVHLHNLDAVREVARKLA
jgi:uncharacterized membrane protein YebE (DUF533 family)